VDIKKRVKFQDQIDSDKIFERAAVHADLRQAEERKKEKKAKKKEQRQDQDGGAAAEAKRRKDLQYEKEKADMSDISHFDRYTSETTTGVTVCREDTYARQEPIDNASDFALAMFLMENNVKL
jgi:sRNA-binding protein